MQQTYKRMSRWNEKIFAITKWKERPSEKRKKRQTAQRNSSAIEMKIKKKRQQRTEATKLSSFAYAQMSAHGYWQQQQKADGTQNDDDGMRKKEAAATESQMGTQQKASSKWKAMQLVQTRHRMQANCLKIKSSNYAHFTIFNGCCTYLDRSEKSCVSAIRRDETICRAAPQRNISTHKKKKPAIRF